MQTDLKEYISGILNESITKVAPVHGADISAAYRIDTQDNSYFLKLNNSSNALDMFHAEAFGLELIGNTKTIKTPEVLACDRFENEAFLLMEYIESKAASKLDFKNLGIQLSKLHQISADSFGLSQDNFIGSLHQSNTLHKNWTDFYSSERLIPQLKLAVQKGLLSEAECPPIQQIEEVLVPLFENVKPSLLHGDLWSGNYVIAKNGTPYLIDPAIYYGHHEVDLAMTKLFGGFNDEFYKSYFSIIPQDSKTASRTDLYQLYYLLVHLNLFGRSYYGSVASILKRYF